MLVTFLTVWRYLDFVTSRFSKDNEMATSRQQLIAEVGNAMQAYQRSTQALDDLVGRRLGLNPADLRCLDWLVDGPKSAGQLSEATGLSSAATTTMIDRLERKGFVRRIRNDTDRRQVLVEMTPSGHERTWEFYGPLATEGAELLRRFTKDQLAMMRDHLVAITELTERHRDRLR
jgi:DNA-binding MarR family transcriptional regulator